MFAAVIGIVEKRFPASRGIPVRRKRRDGGTEAENPRETVKEPAWRVFRGSEGGGRKKESGRHRVGVGVGGEKGMESWDWA